MAAVPPSAPRVLVVEDVPDIATVLRLLLAAEGYEPVLASDGLQALRLAEVQPSLVVLDLLMPSPDGFEVAHALRTRYPDLPILALTAVSSDAEHLRARACGIDEVILKPFDPERLAERVRAWLEERGRPGPRGRTA